MFVNITKTSSLYNSRRFDGHRLLRNQSFTQDLTHVTPK